MTTDTSNGQQQAQAELAAIVEVMARLDTADDDTRDGILQEISEGILDIGVRSDWQTPGEPLTPAEYQILLVWGGPAVRITGSLDEYKQPEDAQLEYQDWLTSWTPFYVEDADARTALLAYAVNLVYA
mgnify:CR=1 FL=1